MTGGAGIDEPFGARAADFDDPFEILEACHARIARMLRTLERLPAHVSAHGVDDEAREAIARVRRYFELAAPDHHADEAEETDDCFENVQRVALDFDGLFHDFSPCAGCLLPLRNMLARLPRKRKTVRVLPQNILFYLPK